MQVYRFITGTDDSAFCHEVTEALSKGWELYRSPTLTVGADGKVVCGQAVTKEAGDVEYHPARKLTEY